MNAFHILNGDALLEQMPYTIAGERIILRECLIDGDVTGNTLEEFIVTRARFITSLDPEYKFEDYQNKVVGEFEKLLSIPVGAEINFWFEDDLFCQVNFWFAAHLLHTNNVPYKAYLVRPQHHTPYGFAAYRPDQLPELLVSKTNIRELSDFSDLWTYYQSENNKELLSKGTELSNTYPFIMDAIEAQLDRTSTSGLGRPERSLLAIMEELNTQEFGPIFKEFCKRESIYGFGDLQVKHMLEKLKS